MLKKILYTSVIAVLLFAAIGFLLPTHVHVERSIGVERPAATVFAVLNSYRNFPAWSPWAARDPEARYALSGPASGVGARLSWDGDPRLVGSGWQEIVASEPYRRIGMRLDFDQQGTADSYFNIVETGQGVRLTWGVDTDLLEGRGLFGGLLARYFGLFFDRWIGEDYEDGLARFKEFVESLPPADFADLDVTIVDVQPQDILYVRIDDMPNPLDVAASLAAAYREISTFMASHAIEREGLPMTITRGRDGQGLLFEAAIPALTAGAEPGGHVRAGLSPGGRAARVVHRGPQDGMGASYEKLAAWMAVHGLEEGRVSWEQYVSDPAQTPPKELLTHIYALLADAP
jgi:effector-binding domain-containing protein